MIKNYSNWISESTNFDHLLTPEQLEWCDKYLGIWKNIKVWTVDEKGFVNVDGDVHINLAHEEFKQFPVKFGKVSGNFNCNHCDSLLTLEGAPYEVNGDFTCNECNSLTTLKGAPKVVGGGFSCLYCDSLTTLEGAPQRVKKGFSCQYCKSLISLDGAPQRVGKGFFCSSCNSLTSLKGGPDYVGGGFYCYSCLSLKSLKGSPRKVGGVFDCGSCPELPKEQVDLVKDYELLRKWFKSGLDIEEFIEKARGMIHGKNFDL